MTQAQVVIGANFGDEGKGLVTDFLAAPCGSDALVVRFNGGAQAAHTVELEDGTRHVFSHFGSGSLVGAATYLSRFFVCNPILFFQESERLRMIGVSPDVYVDPAAPVTTPYDMMINQIAESARGGNKHGSCGVGFGETIERNLKPRFALTVADLYDRCRLVQKLNRIRSQWVPQRLRKLGITDLSPEWEKRFLSDSIMERYLEDVVFFLASTDCELGTSKTCNLAMLSRDHELIFEGAQGLMLDQERGWFPHVTRSNTGLQNVMVLAQEIGLTSLEVNYITRSYLTRHGAGPMPFEMANLPYPRIEDKTNVPNPYQDALRFAWLNLDLLRSSIHEDLRKAAGPTQIRHRLTVTCMDHIDDDVTYIRGGQEHTATPEVFLNTAMRTVSANSLLCSYGPTRETLSTPTFQMA